MARDDGLVRGVGVSELPVLAVSLDAAVRAGDVGYAGEAQALLAGLTWLTSHAEDIGEGDKVTNLEVGHGRLVVFRADEADLLCSWDKRHKSACSTVKDGDALDIKRGLRVQLVRDARWVLSFAPENARPLRRTHVLCRIGKLRNEGAGKLAKLDARTNILKLEAQTNIFHQKISPGMLM